MSLAVAIWDQFSTATYKA